MIVDRFDPVGLWTWVVLMRCGLTSRRVIRVGGKGTISVRNWLLAHITVAAWQEKSSRRVLKKLAVITGKSIECLPVLTGTAPFPPKLRLSWFAFVWVALANGPACPVLGRRPEETLVPLAVAFRNPEEITSHYRSQRLVK